jgi:DNA-binding response OmpR family regulator
VLFMSGYEQQEAAPGDWPEAGAQIIGKPFSRAVLLARVSQLLTADADPGATVLPQQRARARSWPSGRRA